MTATPWQDEPQRQVQNDPSNKFNQLGVKFNQLGILFGGQMPATEWVDEVQDEIS